MITLTYAFGNFTHTIIVQDWKRVLSAMAALTQLNKMDWIRVQISDVI